MRWALVAGLVAAQGADLVTYWHMGPGGELNPVVRAVAVCGPWVLVAAKVGVVGLVLVAARAVALAGRPGLGSGLIATGLLVGLVGAWSNG